MKRRMFVIAVVMGLLLSSVAPMQVTPVQAAGFASDTHAVYLPFVATPPCVIYTAHQYASVNEPVVRVGEPFTVTGVLVNDGCAWLVKFIYVARIYSPAGEVAHKPEYLAPGFGVGPQQEHRMQWGFTLTTTGEYTVTVGASFEAALGPHGPFMWEGAGSPPIIIRVLQDQ